MMNPKHSLMSSPGDTSVPSGGSRNLARFLWIFVVLSFWVQAVAGQPDVFEMQRFSMVEVVGEPQRLRSSFVRGITDLPVQVHPL